jgi:hypothetical protein
MFDLGKNPDFHSYAFRLAHYGVMGGLVGLAIAIFLLFQNFYLIFVIARIREEVRSALRRNPHPESLENDIAVR